LNAEESASFLKKRKQKTFARWFRAAEAVRGQVQEIRSAGSIVIER
jgi:hypothetical protein